MWCVEALRVGCWGHVSATGRWHAKCWNATAATIFFIGLRHVKLHSLKWCVDTWLTNQQWYRLFLCELWAYFRLRSGTRLLAVAQAVWLLLIIPVGCVDFTHRHCSQVGVPVTHSMKRTVLKWEGYGSRRTLLIGTSAAHMLVWCCWQFVVPTFFVCASTLCNRCTNSTVWHVVRESFHPKLSTGTGCGLLGSTCHTC